MPDDKSPEPDEKPEPFRRERFAWKPEDLPGITVEKAPPLVFPQRPRK